VECAADWWAQGGYEGGGVDVDTVGRTANPAQIWA
jgi:hypothetical protein